MTAITTRLFFSAQPIHKTRFIQQRPSHLYKFKTIIQYLIYLSRDTSPPTYTNGISFISVLNLNASSKNKSL